MRSIVAMLGALALTALLSGCGGGGGGSTGGGGSGGGAPSALTFSPTTATANVAAGASATLTLRATATDPSQFTGAIYAFIVDPQQVLTPAVSLTAVNANTQSVTLHTSPSLSQGRYQGTFQVQLCKDSGCAAQIPGSPVPLPYDINVTPGPLSASPATTTTSTVHRGGQLNTTVSINVKGGGATWTATTTTPWLKITSGSGTGNGSFSVGYTTPALAQGSYTGSVLVTSSDGQTASVPFSLEVLPAAFTLTSGVPSFAAVNGAPIAAQPLGFAIDNDVPTPWTAAVSQPWLVATPLSGTTPSTLTLQPNPSVGALASGRYSANVVLSSAGLADKTVTTNLTLTAPLLSAPATALTLGGPKGRDMVSGQSTTLTLNTGTNSWPFALSSLPAWLRSPTATGTVGGSGASVTLAPVIGAVTPGSVSTTVNVTATVNGDRATWPLTVNLNADQRRLLPSQWGVGLTASTAGNVLSRTLTVTDNYGAALAWTATSDQRWLAVTPNGTTAATGAPSSLTLSADAASLPANTMSYATVTIATGTAGVAPATVRVGLWKGSSVSAIQKLPLNYSHLVGDPIRPYVYLHNGGSTLDVYHLHTAQKVATLSGMGAALGAMTVSADGNWLYALDTANKSMSVIQLSNNSKVASWPLTYPVTSFSTVLAIRPNGVDVVLVGDGTAYANGRSVGGNTGISGLMAASADGTRVFTQGVGGAPSTTYAFEVDYTDMSGGAFMVTRRATGSTNVYDRDVAVSPDGSRLYLGDGPPYECTSVDPTTMRYIGGLPGNQNLYVNNIKVASDGRVVCLGTNYTDDKNYVEIHAVDGTLLKTLTFSSTNYSNGAKNGRMALSPDGLMAVVQTGDPATVFIPIGP